MALFITLPLGGITCQRFIIITWKSRDLSNMSKDLLIHKNLRQLYNENEFHTIVVKYLLATRSMATRLKIKVER